MKRISIRFVFVCLVLSALMVTHVFAGGGSQPSQRTGSTTLRVFTYQFSPTNNFVQQMANRYMELNPNVNIVVEEYPWSSYFENLEVRFASRNPNIDVLVMDIPMIAGYSERGFIEDLRRWIPESDFSSKVAEGSLEAIRYNGQIIASPLQNSDQYLFINKQMALDAGVQLPSVFVDRNTIITEEFANAWGNGSWTWEETLAAAQKMTRDTNGDGITDVFGLHFEQAARLYQLQPLGGSRGGRIISPDGTTTRGYFDQQVWVDAVQFYGDLFNRFRVSPPAALLPGFEPRSELVKGTYAMMIGGGWNLRDIMNSDQEFIIAAHPRWANGRTTTPTGSWVVGVTSFGSDATKQAAADFVNWWSLSQEGTRKWYGLTNELPATRFMLDQLATSREFDQFPLSAQRLGVWQVLNTADPRPVTPYFQIVNEGVDRAFLEAAQGKNARQAVLDAVEFIETRIERARR